MKSKYLLYSALFLFAMSSCEDKLDADRYFGDRMTIEKVFADRDYSERWLSDAYSHLIGVNATGWHHIHRIVPLLLSWIACAPYGRLPPSSRVHPWHGGLVHRKMP